MNRALILKALCSSAVLSLACVSFICRGADNSAPKASNAALTNLVFDSETQVAHVSSGARQAAFDFQITNVSDVAVHILGIPASCGCTRAELPRTPWIIPPHTNETLHVTMSLNGLPGENSKYLTIGSTNGTKQIWVKAITPAPAPAATTNSVLEQK